MSHNSLAETALSVSTMDLPTSSGGNTKGPVHPLRKRPNVVPINEHRNSPGIHYLGKTICRGRSPSWHQPERDVHEVIVVVPGRRLVESIAKFQVLGKEVFIVKLEAVERYHDPFGLLVEGD